MYNNVSNCLGKVLYMNTDIVPCYKAAFPLGADPEGGSQVPPTCHFFEKPFCSASEGNTCSCGHQSFLEVGQKLVGCSDKTLGSCWDINLHPESNSIFISCNLKLNIGLRVVNRTTIILLIYRLTDIFFIWSTNSNNHEQPWLHACTAFFLKAVF